MTCAFAASACSALPDGSSAEIDSQSTIDSSDAGASSGQSSDPAPGDQVRSGDDPAGKDPSPGADGEGSPGDEVNPTTPPSINEDEVTERLAALGGRLAVGNGPELSVVRPDGAGGLLIDGSEAVVAGQPTWSHDGERLAWSSISAERQIVQVQDFGDDGRPSGEPLSTDAAGPPVFYLQWNEGDDRLAYIRNAPSGGVVEVGIIDPGLPVEPIGKGAPFFISWSPAPDRLLGHVNELSIDAYDGAAAVDVGFTSILPVSGGFSAPAWVDGQRALIVADGRLTYLHVATGATEPIVEIGGPVRFVLSPDRTKVAYQVIGGPAGPSLISQPASPAAVVASDNGSGASLPVQQGGVGLTVLDLNTLEEQVVTAELAVAWEWSPDSTKLAWLDATIADRRPIGRWNFWSNGAAPATARSSQFVISRKYGQAYLPFFAQYAQSVTGWSPDSSAFAFAGTIGTERGVWIQLIFERVDPRMVSVGDFVTWGRGTPLPAGGTRASAA